MKRLMVLLRRNWFGSRSFVTKQKFVLTALLVVGLVTVGSVAGQAKASALALSTVPPGQVTIYSNLGPGNSYDPWNSWCVVLLPWPPNPALCPPAPQAVAMAFTGNGGYVTQIDLGLTFIDGTNAATVQLATDNGYPAPSQVLRSWQVANQPLIYTCPCGLTTVHVSPAIPVAAGRRYWVIVRPGTSMTADAWNHTYNAAQGLIGVYYDWWGRWQVGDAPMSAFDVIGCPKLCKVN